MMDRTCFKPNMRATALLLAAALGWPLAANAQAETGDGDAPQQAPPAAAPSDPGGLYADGQAQPGADKPDEAEPRDDALTVGETFELPPNAENTYHFKAESAGMLTLMVAGRGRSPGITVTGPDGRTLAQAGSPQGIHNARQQIRIGGGFDDFNSFSGPVQLSPDGTSIAMTIPIPSEGVYRVALSAVGEVNNDDKPTAGAQWLDMGQTIGPGPGGPALPAGPAEPPNRPNQPAAPANQPITADNILEQATALASGRSTRINRFDQEESAWLAFTAEQAGVLVVTARSNSADIQLSFHDTDQLAEPFLYVDSDRGNDLGNEAAVIPLGADQAVLVHLFAYGHDPREGVRVRAVFVPDEADADEADADADDAEPPADPPADPPAE